MEHQEIFRDYEVVKGRMDDVFSCCETENDWEVSTDEGSICTYKSKQKIVF